MNAAPSPPLPRLRITRAGPYPASENGIMAPASYVSSDVNLDSAHEDEVDDASTPRRSTGTLAGPSKTTSNSASALAQTDTPAARLRALIARDSSTATSKPSSRPPAPSSVSELDSDFDPPNHTPKAPSFAKDSLKDMFSRALRDPGDTPRKERPRRNSIDVSEVEASPRMQRVRKEREKTKGKRKSLSDDEFDNLPEPQQRSFRSSQAATFDSLRARLTASSTSTEHPRTATPPPEESLYELSDVSVDTSNILKHLNSSSAGQPEATSTPVRSMQIPSFQSQSNLMDHDSEMQRALANIDTDYSPRQRTLSHPHPRTPAPQRPAPARPTSMISHSLTKSHSHDRLREQHPGHERNHSPQGHSTDQRNGSLSRSSSSLSGHDRKVRNQHADHDRLHELEREWNKPHPKPHSGTPERDVHLHHHRHNSHGSGSQSESPVRADSRHGLTRQGSGASVVSVSDSIHSRASSGSSQADYRERMNEQEKERNRELEHGWNKPHPSRPSSSLGAHRGASHENDEHQRDHAGSALSRSHSHSIHLTPALYPHHSSRTSSPNGSISSHGSSEKGHEVEVQHEVEHVRERNWNSPRPNWKVDPDHRHHHERFDSPNLHVNGSGTGQHLQHSSSHSSLTAPSRNSRSRSPRPPEATSESPATYDLNHRQHRPNSPLPPPPLNSSSNGDKAVPSNSRSVWQFPRNKSPLPPLELDDASPERRPPLSDSRHLRTPSSPTQRSMPTSRASGTDGASHIPVWPSQKPQVNGVQRDNEHKKGHRRNSTELSESIGRIPRFSADSAPSVLKLPSEDALSEVSEDTTPRMGVITLDMPVLSPVDPVSTSVQREPPVLPVTSLGNDLLRMQKALDHSPSAFPSQPMSSLSTPPRRRYSNTSKMEFQTPSPPKGLPDLPGPPSSSSEEDVQDFGHAARSDVTLIKTPRPPGAWGTPAPPQTISSNRSRSSSMSEAGSEHQTDIATATPRVALARATSLPLQTPAPPGAWTATPYSGRKKVRFDDESSEPEASTIGHINGYVTSPITENAEPIGNTPEEAHPSNTSPKSSDSPPRTSVNVAVNGLHDRGEPLLPPAPPSTTVPTRKAPRRSPSIRMVDAFGREQVSDDGDHKVQEVSNAEPSGIESPRKSRIRLVDAMGREIAPEIGAVEVNGHVPEIEDQGVRMSRNEALVQVKKSLTNLSEGLNDMDSVPDNLNLNDDRLHELGEISRTARIARNKLSRTLQLARSNGNELTEKYWSLRANMKNSKILTAAFSPRPISWNWSIFWFMVAVQILVVYVMYRMSASRARHLFLTTYYDPFYPDLHRYTQKPDIFRRSMSSVPPSLSVFAIPETVQRLGWQGIIGELWVNTTHIVSAWRRDAWNAWREDTRPAIQWPPT